VAKHHLFNDYWQINLKHLEKQDNIPTDKVYFKKNNLKIDLFNSVGYYQLELKQHKMVQKC